MTLGGEDPCIKVTDKCQVFTSIGKFYRDPVTCNVVDMDKCHILLRRLWQHDVGATYKGRDNIYVFTWKGKRVAMKPIPLPPESTKKKLSYLIFLCHQLDRNSRASSFEEEGLIQEKRQQHQAHGSRNNSFGRSPRWPKYPPKITVNRPVDHAKAERWDLTVGRPTPSRE